MGEAKLRRMLPTWTPMERAENVPPTPAQRHALVTAWIGQGFTSEQVEAELRKVMEAEVWKNSRYTVHVRRQEPEAGPALVHLSIKRNDRQPPGPERFRDFQRIKNELVGPECEGMELYPAESRLVDTANSYHMWVIDDRTFRWPWGFSERAIIGESVGGAIQQPFEE